MDEEAELADRFEAHRARLQRVAYRTLGSLSEHLKKLPPTRTGSAFIVDELGLLVAASDGPVNSADGRRLAPADSTSAVARAIGGIGLGVGDGRDDFGPRVESHQVTINNEPARVQVTQLWP